MGETQSLQLPQQAPPNINHHKFKDIKFIKQDNVIRNIITIQHESQYEEWQKKLNKIVNIDDQVILLPRAFQYTHKAICGTSGTIQIDYDNYPYILAEELKNRQKVNRHFQQPQIWYLLYSLVTAAHDFQKINSKIGDVRPENIFINEEGHIKVSNLYSWPGEVTNYIKTVFDNQNTYLSPQEAQTAKQGQSQTYLNKFKSQSFSIGLTVLQSAMIRPLNYLYLEDKTFDSFNFNKIIKQWWTLVFASVNQQTKQVTQKQYSESLKLSIAALCQVQPNDRILSDQIYNWLKNHHQEINQLIPFQPGIPPIKNLNKYQHLLKNSNVTSKNPPPPDKLPQNNVNYTNSPSTGHHSLNKYPNKSINQVTYINPKTNMQTPTIFTIQPTPHLQQNIYPQNQNIHSIQSMPFQQRQFTSAMPTTSTYVANTQPPPSFIPPNKQNLYHNNRYFNNSPPANGLLQQPCPPPPPQLIINQQQQPPPPYQLTFLPNNESQLSPNNIKSLSARNKSLTNYNYLSNKPVNNNSAKSDFLKQIDEQLARSRQEFKFK